MDRIMDMRPIINSIEDADRVMDAIAQAEARIALTEARAEKRIADIKHKTELDVAEDQQLAKSLKRALASYIDANRDQFKRPRKRKTSQGSYGLQAVTELIVDNKSKLVQTLLDRGYDDCLKVTHSPVKSAVAKRIQDGETFPGCAVFSGDTAVCKVNKAVIDAAKKEAK